MPDPKNWNQTLLAVIAGSFIGFLALGMAIHAILPRERQALAWDRAHSIAHPAAGADPCVQYVVQPGETLSGLAARLAGSGGDVGDWTKRICMANGWPRVRGIYAYQGIWLPTQPAVEPRMVGVGKETP